MYYEKEVREGFYGERSEKFEDMRSTEQKGEKDWNSQVINLYSMDWTSKNDFILTWTDR